jgi:galactose-1-phosphate uridylyltransferase
MLGLTEVRGIYLPPELHKEMRAMAQKLCKQSNKAKAKND